MSIIAYTGLPGSGKSYTVVEHQILPALKAGLLVVTNLPLKKDLLKAEIGGEVRDFPMELVSANPDSIEEHCPAGCLLVLDEVWRIFPAGKRADQVPEAFRSLFAEHRHRVDASGRSTQIVLVTQDLAQISAFARQLVETTFRTVKLSNLGLNTRYRTDVYNGPQSGPNPPINARIREMVGRYEPRVFRFYVSHTQSEAGKEGADERPVDRRANIFKRPLLMLTPVIMIALTWFGIHILWSHHAKKAVEPSPLATPLNIPSGGGHAPSGAAPGAREVSASWRVSGTLEGDLKGAGGWAMVTDGKATRWVPLSQCRRHAHGVACPVDGEMWADTGRYEGKAVSGVVATLQGAVGTVGTGLAEVAKSTGLGRASE